ncbi:hypothetical protein GQR58_029556 [Nymphon striatum]|nr:hypothetical protein GQR58_029556 [Nymphon striatum]
MDCKVWRPRGKKLHQIIDWIEMIPFPETRSYVQRVMENLQVYKMKLNQNTSIEDDLRLGKNSMAMFIGTSRGGLIIMALAGMRPSVLKAAVLNDIGPVIDGAGLMQIRGYLQQLNAPKNWAQAVETQKAIMAKNFPAFTEDDWEHEAACRYVKDQSAIKADYDPNLAKTMRALDARSRLPTAWPQFAGLKNIPLLVIRGENSNILSHKTLLDMAQVHHRMEHFTAVGQGHAPALHVGEIPSRIRDFLIRTSL